MSQPTDMHDEIDKPPFWQRVKSRVHVGPETRAFLGEVAILASVATLIVGAGVVTVLSAHEDIINDRITNRSRLHEKLGLGTVYTSAEVTNTGKEYIGNIPGLNVTSLSDKTNMELAHLSGVEDEAIDEEPADYAAPQSPRRFNGQERAPAISYGTESGRAGTRRDTAEFSKPVFQFDASGLLTATRDDIIKAAKAVGCKLPDHYRQLPQDRAESVTRRFVDLVVRALSEDHQNTPENRANFWNLVVGDQPLDAYRSMDKADIEEDLTAKRALSNQIRADRDARENPQPKQAAPEKTPSTDSTQYKTAQQISKADTLASLANARVDTAKHAEPIALVQSNIETEAQYDSTTILQAGHVIQVLPRDMSPDDLATMPNIVSAAEKTDHYMTASYIAPDMGRDDDHRGAEVTSKVFSSAVMKHFVDNHDKKGAQRFFFEVDGAAISEKEAYSKAQTIFEEERRNLAMGILTYYMGLKHDVTKPVSSPDMASQATPRSAMLSK